MDYSPPSDIVQLGIDAAKELLGEDAVVELRVEEGEDSTEQPAYFFYYKIIKGRVFDYTPGLLRIRLGLKIIDKLYDRRDDNYPYIKSLELLENLAGA